MLFHPFLLKRIKKYIFLQYFQINGFSNRGYVCLIFAEIYIETELQYIELHFIQRFLGYRCLQ